MEDPVNKIHIRGGLLNLSIMVCLAIVVGVSTANVAYFAKLMDYPSQEVSRGTARIMVGMNAIILIISFLVLSYQVYRMVLSYEHKFNHMEDAAKEYGITEDNVHSAIKKKPKHRVMTYDANDPLLEGEIEY